MSRIERDLARFNLVEAKWNARRAAWDAVTAAIKAVAGLALLALVVWLAFQGDGAVQTVVELLRIVR